MTRTVALDGEIIVPIGHGGGNNNKIQFKNKTKGPSKVRPMQG